MDSYDIWNWLEFGLWFSIPGLLLTAVQALFKCIEYSQEHILVQCMRFGTHAIPRASFQFVSLCRLSDLSHIRPVS